MKSKKIGSALEQSLWTSRVVRIVRASNPGVKIDGFVVGLGESFVLVHQLDSGGMMSLDGYTALPLHELTEAHIRDSYDDVIGRALHLKKVIPIPQPDILLLDFPGLLSSVNAHFPLIKLFTERKYRNECYIGRADKLTNKSVVLREIDPGACWKRIEKYRFKDITRVEFGDEYAKVLWMLSEDERRKSEDSVRQAENEK